MNFPIEKWYLYVNKVYFSCYIYLNANKFYVINLFIQ